MIISPSLTYYLEKEKEKGKKDHALLTKVHEELASMNIHFTSHKEYTYMSILEVRDLVGKIQFLEKYISIFNHQHVILLVRGGVQTNKRGFSLEV